MAESRVEIKEAYRDYVPPKWVRRHVDGLLTRVDEKHLGGLKTIVLTNARALSGSRKRHRTRSRGQQVPVRECCGLYHARWRGEPAWIELYVDNIVSQLPGWLTLAPGFRYGLLARTLYHEIGHHIHATTAPEHREREDVADKWSNRLMRDFMRRKYWFVVPVMRAIRPVAQPLLRWLAMKAGVSPREFRH